MAKKADKDKLIKISELYKTFKTEDVETKVLRGIDFEIKKGEFISIMGPSGSGKSTLMHILGFLDTLTSGKYIFENQDVSILEDDQLAEMRSKKVGFVFQAFNLLNRTSALENVMLPLNYVKISPTERKKKAKKALEDVGLGHRLEHSPNKLSGGEKQRVAIARALVNSPDVIFADEPTGNLDSKSGLQVMKILQTLHKKGNTIILVTHERYTAEHAERIIKIRDGKIEEDFKVSKRQLAELNGDLTK